MALTPKPQSEILASPNIIFQTTKKDSLFVNEDKVYPNGLPLGYFLLLAYSAGLPSALRTRLSHVLVALQRFELACAMLDRRWCVRASPAVCTTLCDFSFGRALVGTQTFMRRMTEVESALDSLRKSLMTCVETVRVLKFGGLVALRSDDRFIISSVGIYTVLSNLITEKCDFPQYANVFGSTVPINVTSYVVALRNYVRCVTADCTRWEYENFFRARASRRPERKHWTYAALLPRAVVPRYTTFVTAADLRAEYFVNGFLPVVRTHEGTYKMTQPAEVLPVVEHQPVNTLLLGALLHSELSPVRESVQPVADSLVAVLAPKRRLEKPMGADSFAYIGSFQWEKRYVTMMVDDTQLLPFPGEIELNTGPDTKAVAFDLRGRAGYLIFLPGSTTITNGQQFNDETWVVVGDKFGFLTCQFNTHPGARTVKFWVVISHDGLPMTPVGALAAIAAM